MKTLVYKQFNTELDTLNRMNKFLQEKEVKPTVTTYPKKVWHELYHDVELKHLFIVTPTISKKLSDMIVFAVNRNINCYIISDRTELVKIKGLKATYSTDPNNTHNLIWERVSHTAFYPNDLDMLLKEAEVQFESLEDRCILRKNVIQLKKALNEVTWLPVEFPTTAQMLEEISRDAEPFDIEINYNRLPKKIVEHYSTDASVGQLRDHTAAYKFNGITIDEDTTFELNEDYINYIAEMWLTIQYYKAVGCTPNAKEYKQCSCSQWHHRIRVQHCPKCDALNTEYVETLVKDFQVELDSNEDVA